MNKIILSVAWILFIQPASCGQGLLIEANEIFPGINNLEIKGRFCNVQVVGGEGTDVELNGYIKGIRHVDGFAIRHEKKGNQLSVWVETPQISWGNVSGELQLKVPKNCNVMINNGSGSISVNNLQYAGMIINNGSGSVRMMDITSNSKVRTVSGNIQIENHKGNVDASTTSGSHQLKNISGDVDAKSVSGSININEAEGDVRVVTTSGGIRLTNVEGALNLKTTSGSIRGSGVMLTNNTLFNSISGSITMNLRNSAKELGYNLSSASGSITVNGQTVTKRYSKDEKGLLMISSSSTSGSQTFTSRGT
jgi:DUF4097 and DUF4098 domain-containing protein YvlB